MAGGRQSASQAENVGSTESLNPKFGFPGGAADSAALTSVQEPEGAHGCSWRVLSRRKLVSNAVPDAMTHRSTTCMGGRRDSRRTPASTK